MLLDWNDMAVAGRSSRMESTIISPASGSAFSVAKNREDTCLAFNNEPGCMQSRSGITREF